MTHSFVFLGMLALSAPAFAHSFESPGTEVAVSVEVEGRDAPLYPAPDGSNRLYLEARAGSSYAVALRNLTGQRLGIDLDVDGLNAIDGLRKGGRERLYILDPWQTTLVRGWRSSLNEVHRFTFVDEATSYAARTGQANGHMGWIEAKVFREQAPPTRESAIGRADGASPPQAKALQGGAPMERRSYPGTGWGDASADPAVEVAFDPEPSPCQQVTLRYEYRKTLLALGVLQEPARDRLWEREHGGFAKPPLP
jgi:hypothetical protein